MTTRRLFTCLCVSVLFLVAASPAMAQRAFVSAKTGSDSNPCTLASPCRSFGTAIAAAGAGGEVVALDSGGYGPVTITKAITIESPAGIYAGITAPSGDAITVNAGSSDVVTLRGLTLNAGTNNGITVNSVGTLNVENCFITGFTNLGIGLNSDGRLNVKGTDIKACGVGVRLINTTGVVQASIDHCHLDGNNNGFDALAMSPGSSTTTASYTTANNTFAFGWICGGNGKNVLNLEFCTGSENGIDGLLGNSTNALSAARYSNCVFANNGRYGVNLQSGTGTLETRGNNTVTGNGTAPTFGTIGSFSPM